MRVQKQIFLEAGLTEKRESLSRLQVPIVKASPMMLRARALNANHDWQTHTPVYTPAPVAGISNQSRARCKPVSPRFFSGHHPLQPTPTDLPQQLKGKPTVRYSQCK